MHFIKKIYIGYSKIPENGKKYARSHFIGGIIHPFNLEEYIEFNLQILKDSVKSDYLLEEDIMRNLIILNPKEIVDDVFKIFNSGINKNALSQMLRLISMIPSKKSYKILKNYLGDEDWHIRNTAFNTIQTRLERENSLWYNNEET